MGLDAERKPLRVAAFGATSTVTDSKTVTVCLESIDGSIKKRVFLWTTPKICEMTAVNWSPNARKLDHLRDLEIRKPVEHGEVYVLIGSDYYEELLLPLEHRIGKSVEPVGVKTNSDGQSLDVSQKQQTRTVLLTVSTHSIQPLLRT